MKSGNLNFLKHSRPLQACNGTALAFNYIKKVEADNMYHIWERLETWVDIA